MSAFNVEKMNEIISVNLGSIYVGKSFENYTDKESVKKITELLSDDTWLYIHGESRSGKTHLASAIYQWYTMHGISGVRIRKCITLDMLFSDYRNDEREDKIEDIKTATILILDDIGVGKLTHERHSMYYYIIDYRISNNKKTILTSNYRTNDLWNEGTDVSPARIITRIQEASTGIELTRVGKTNAV